MSTIGLKKSPSNPSLLVPVIKVLFLILFYVQLERYIATSFVFFSLTWMSGPACAYLD
jgi:hypothetical protein